MNIQKNLTIKNHPGFKIWVFTLVSLVIILSTGCSQSQPAESISWQRKFDGQDRLTELTDPAGKKTLFSYSEDLSGATRVTTTNADGSIVAFEYDDRGLITAIEDAHGNINYRYDAIGRLLQVQRAGEPAIRYRYDSEGRIASQSIGDFYNIDYQYDFMGRLSSLNTPAGIINYEYQLGQGLVIRDLPNGIKTIWEFGVNGQLQTVTHVDRQNLVIAEFRYQYRPDGLIDAIAEKTRNNETVTFYKYDTVGRLTHVSDKSGNRYQYEYDLLGNRVRATSFDGKNQINEYDWAGRLVSSDGKKCSYDAAGNLHAIHFGNSEMNYNYSQDQQLASVNDKVFYKYGGDGLLLERQVDGVATKYISNPLSDFWQPLVMENHVGTKTMLIWDGDSPLITITNGQAEYVLHDHLGSARMIVDGSGEIKKQMNYSPFGEPDYESGGNGITVGFSGLFYDPLAKQYLTRARAYNPSLGQFMQIEPEQRIPIGSQMDISLYAYCGYDPVNYVDVNGRAPEPTPYAWLYAKAFVRALPRTIAESWGAGMDFWKNAFRGGGVKLGAQPGSLADQAGRMGGIGPERTVQALSGIAIASSAYVGVSALATKLTAMGIQAGTKAEPFHIGVRQFMGKKVPEIVHYGINKYGPHIGLALTGPKASLHLYDTHTFLGSAKTGIVLPSYHYLLPIAYEVTNAAIPKIRSIWQNVDDFLVPPAYGDEILPSNVGGIALSGAGDVLSGIGQIEGLTIDANNNLILISKMGKQKKLPSIRIDDIVTVFRSVYIHGEGPTVTIDPNPNDPEHSAMIIKHGKATENTYVGWVLYHADRLMKTYMLGVDNITQTEATSRVPGYQAVLNAIYFGDGVSNSSSYEGKWERFWIVPAEVNQFSAEHNDLTLFDVPLKLNTQVMKWEDEELVDDPAGKSSLGAKKFTEWFTNNYDSIASEKYLAPPPGLGMKDSVPVFTELRQIAFITALAERMRDQGVSMPFWMRNYEVKQVQFEEYTPALVITRTDGSIKSKIFGGVSLSANSKEVKQYKTISDVKKLPEKKRVNGEQNLKLANTLSTAVREYTMPTRPAQLAELKVDDQSFQMLRLPGTESKTLSPCRIDETDLTVDIPGGRHIRLSRHFNSFFNPKDIWGQTWTMNLPRLEKIKIQNERTAKQVSYNVAYDLFTPLNSIYVRFSKVEEVPALQSRLQVPNTECEFFGLANSAPNFLSNSTLELIGKTGESWHFTESGDLIAMEKDGFRSVYLRNESGNVRQIVGLLGRTRIASIDLEYDQSERLVSATGKNHLNETQTVRYEYDASGKLSRVASAQGKFAYVYQDQWVSEISLEDYPDTQNAKSIRFEYNSVGQLIAKYDGQDKGTSYSLSSKQGSATLEITRNEDDPGVSSIYYDDTFRPLEIHYNDGAQVEWEYPESGGSSIEIVDPNGKKIHISESPDGTQRITKSELFPTITETYDTIGRLTQVNSGDQKLLRQQWYPSGKLETIETENPVVKPQYDADGLTESITIFPPGSNNQPRKWETVNLDFAGKPVAINDYSGLDIAIQYDPHGNVSRFIHKRDGNNYGYELSRNEDGRIESVKSSWGNDLLSYDSNGALSKLIINKSGFQKESQAVVEFTSGRVDKLRQYDGSEIDISYDNSSSSSGLASQIKWPNGLELNYHYNSSGDLEKINLGNERQISLIYDNKGRIVDYAFRKH